MDTASLSSVVKDRAWCWGAEAGPVLKKSHVPRRRTESRAADRRGRTGRSGGRRGPVRGQTGENWRFLTTVMPPVLIGWI